MQIGPAPLRWPCLAAALLAGCSAERPYPPLTLPSNARLVELHSTPAGYPISQAPADHKVAAFRPRTVLVLTGGGANGAYTVGALNGWTANGTRPSFDVVTGI